MWRKTEGEIAKLCPFSLGVAFGVTEGLFMLGLAWAGWLGGYGLTLISSFGDVFSGFGPSFMGGLIGGGWGLLEGFIFGFIAGVIYDCCLCCCKKSCRSSEKE
jgi:hypothetical protein